MYASLITFFAARSAKLVEMDWKNRERIEWSDFLRAHLWSLETRSRNNISYWQLLLFFLSLQLLRSIFLALHRTMTEKAFNICHSFHFVTHHIIYRKSFSQVVAQQWYYQNFPTKQVIEKKAYLRHRRLSNCLSAWNSKSRKLLYIQNHFYVHNVVVMYMYATMALWSCVRGPTLSGSWCE